MQLNMTRGLRRVHAGMRLRPLEAMHRVQTIMCSMIMFECLVCETRFPTFHPDHVPPMQLDVTRHCSNEVADWENDERPGPPTEMAKLYKGRCRACVVSLQKVENDEGLAGVAVFSARNQQLPWHGFPADDRVTKLQLTKLELFKQATVLESMLVSLAHMQVSVCMFEGRHGSKSGIHTSVFLSA